MSENLPPIALFAYNRPHHLERCLEFIDRSQKCLNQPLPLYIFCDAPKNEHAFEATEKTQEVAKSHSSATVIVREENHGFNNIVNGITELCNKFDQVIVIEDDVLISPDFLPFMIKGLKEYAQNPKVFALSGYMYFAKHPKAPEFFSSPIFFVGDGRLGSEHGIIMMQEPKGISSDLPSEKSGLFLIVITLSLFPRCYIRL